MGLRICLTILCRRHPAKSYKHALCKSEKKTLSFQLPPGTSTLKSGPQLSHKKKVMASVDVAAFLSARRHELAEFLVVVQKVVDQRNLRRMSGAAPKRYRRPSSRNIALSDASHDMFEKKRRRAVFEGTVISRGSPEGRLSTAEQQRLLKRRRALWRARKPAVWRRKLRRRLLLRRGTTDVAVPPSLAASPAAVVKLPSHQYLCRRFNFNRLALCTSSDRSFSQHTHTNPTNGTTAPQENGTKSASSSAKKHSTQQIKTKKCVHVAVASRFRRKRLHALYRCVAQHQSSEDRHSTEVVKTSRPLVSDLSHYHFYTSKTLDGLHTFTSFKQAASWAQTGPLQLWSTTLPADLELEVVVPAVLVCIPGAGKLDEVVFVLIAAHQLAGVPPSWSLSSLWSHLAARSSFQSSSSCAIVMFEISHGLPSHGLPSHGLPSHGLPLAFGDELRIMESKEGLRSSAVVIPVSTTSTWLVWWYRTASGGNLLSQLPAKCDVISHVFLHSRKFFWSLVYRHRCCPIGMEERDTLRLMQGQVTGVDFGSSFNPFATSITYSNASNRICVLFRGGGHVVHSQPGGVVFRLTMVPRRNHSGKRWKIDAIGILGRSDYSLFFGCRAGTAHVTNETWYKHQTALQVRVDSSSGLEGKVEEKLFCSARCTFDEYFRRSGASKNAGKPSGRAIGPFLDSPEHCVEVAWQVSQSSPLIFP